MISTVEQQLLFRAFSVTMVLKKTIQVTSGFHHFVEEIAVES
jgi:hypothetical protein